MQNNQVKESKEMPTNEKQFILILEDLNQLYSNLTNEIHMKKSEIENLKLLYEELQIETRKVEKIYISEIKKKLTTTVNDLRKIGDSALLITNYIEKNDKTSVAMGLNNILLLTTTISDRFFEWNILNEEDRLNFEGIHEVTTQMSKQVKKKRKIVKEDLKKEDIETQQFDFELVETK